jgi:hypothetical protein
VHHAQARALAQHGWDDEFEDLGAVDGEKFRGSFPSFTRLGLGIVDEAHLMEHSRGQLELVPAAINHPYGHAVSPLTLLEISANRFPLTGG